MLNLIELHNEPHWGTDLNFKTIKIQRKIPEIKKFQSKDNYALKDKFNGDIDHNVGCYCRPYVRYKSVIDPCHRNRKDAIYMNVCNCVMDTYICNLP